MSLVTSIVVNKLYENGVLGRSRTRNGTDSAQSPARHGILSFTSPGRRLPSLRRLFVALFELEQAVQHAYGDYHEYEKTQTDAQHDDDHVVRVLGLRVFVHVRQKAPDRRPVVCVRDGRFLRRRRFGRGLWRFGLVRPTDGRRTIRPSRARQRGQKHVFHEVQSVPVRHRADLQKRNTVVRLLDETGTQLVAVVF